ncbi:hypothetical protein [Poseidonocella sp. HB161398]|uniref:hypothetical protein n=1 Tax=Poseidonocella sp. HB161398 TaxID=2320855 RepID=UPI001107FC21|nr:hypothetical protein [Poseidonocella sp. HB161398]
MTGLLRLRAAALLAGLMILVLAFSAGRQPLRLPPSGTAALAQVHLPEARAILHAPVLLAAVPDPQGAPPDPGPNPGLLPGDLRPAPPVARPPLRGFPAATAPPRPAPRTTRFPRAPPFA